MSEENGPERIISVYTTTEPIQQIAVIEVRGAITFWNYSGSSRTWDYRQSNLQIVHSGSLSDEIINEIANRVRQGQGMGEFPGHRWIADGGKF